MRPDRGAFLFIRNINYSLAYNPFVGRGHIRYGMIATGNHLNLLRCALRQPRRRTDGIGRLGQLQNRTLCADFTARLSNLVGGVMTPPYEWCSVYR